MNRALFFSLLLIPVFFLAANVVDDWAAVPPQNTKTIAPTTHVDAGDGCMIVASQAASELRAYVPWVEVLRFDIYTQAGAWVGNHVVTTWVPWTGGPVFLYDQFIVNGSIQLPLHGPHRPQQIADALQSLRPAFILKNADFVR